MLRVVRPEAGECHISLEMWQEKDFCPSPEPVRVLRLAVLKVVHHNRFYDRSPVGNGRTVDYFPAARPHTLILSISIQNITKVS